MPNPFRTPGERPVYVDEPPTRRKLTRLDYLRLTPVWLFMLSSALQVCAHNYLTALFCALSAVSHALAFPIRAKAAQT